MSYVLRRLGFYLIAFWASITLNFMLPRLMPGDPVQRMLAKAQGQLQPEQIESLRRLLGVDDRPLWQQYVDYIHSVFTGDMGISISRFPSPVTEVIGSQILWTLLLGGTALIFAFIIGNGLGIIAAWRRGGFVDSTFPPVLIFIGSFPYFWLAMGALYLFGISRMKEIHRVFQYHGAEHKTIHAYEAGQPLEVEHIRAYSTLHPRCGTNFMLIVMVVSIFVFAFLGWPDLWERILSRIILLPLIAGVSYEIIRFAGRSDQRWVACAITPGLWLQKMTTREPSDDQIEVAIKALEAVRPEE